MQDTEVIYEVLAASFMLNLTVWALNYLGHCGEMFQYIVLWKHQVQGPIVRSGLQPSSGSTQYMWRVSLFQPDLVQVGGPRTSKD